MLKKFDLSSTQETVEGIDLHVISIQGYLDSSTFPQLQDFLQELIDQNNYSLIVEFSELNYISSAGLGVLMGMLQEVRENKGDLKLANMSSKIRNLFDMLGFSRLVRIYDTIDLAKEAFVEESQATNGEDGSLANDDY